MRKTMIGGQALLEGLLMMGPEDAAIAIRKPDGEIVVDKRPLPAKSVISKIPFLRGSVNLFRQMVFGVKALMYSADFIELEEEEKPSKIDAFIEKVFGDKLKDAVIYFSVILSLGLSVGLFILLPNVVTGLAANIFGFNKEMAGGSFILNLIEGIIRILIFFGYLYLATLLNDIKRVWEYHGAEHKTIHCYEHEEELTVENIKKYSTKHPRCGTSFMFLVMVISVLVFAVIGWYGIIMNVILRILLIPVVAGVSFEILKFAGRHSENPIMKVLNAPGMLFQMLTTREPDEKQIEVAIAAFNGVTIPSEGADKW